MLEINKKISAVWEFKVNGLESMEEYNEDYIFFVDGFFKREGENLQTKNPRKTTTENIIKTVNNFSHILFCRYYVDFGSKNLFVLHKNKIQQRKGQKSISVMS